jgi:predicted tellurium resistance membrane protein TerC
MALQRVLAVFAVRQNAIITTITNAVAIMTIALMTEATATVMNTRKNNLSTSILF